MSGVYPGAGQRPQCVECEREIAKEQILRSVIAGHGVICPGCWKVIDAVRRLDFPMVTACTICRDLFNPCKDPVPWGCRCGKVVVKRMRPEDWKAWPKVVRDA